MPSTMAARRVNDGGARLRMGERSCGSLCVFGLSGTDGGTYMVDHLKGMCSSGAPLHLLELTRLFLFALKWRGRGICYLKSKPWQVEVRVTTNSLFDFSYSCSHSRRCASLAAK